MGAQSKRPEDNWRRDTLIVWLAFFSALALTIMCASGCSPKIYERVIVQRDTTQIVKIDSVRYLEKDSVFVREKGDTVYKYVERIRYRDRVKVDTVLKVRVDSVAFERAKEVKVEKPLSWWQKSKIGAFWWLIGALIACLLWIFRKPLLKIIVP